MTMSSLNGATIDVAASLLAAPDSASRASLAASAIVDRVEDSACVVHRFSGKEGESVWTAIGAAGEISVQQGSLRADSQLIALLLEPSPQTVIYAGDQLRREDYAHLHLQRSIASLAYVPLVNGGVLVGAAEILTFSAGLQAEDIEAIDPVLHLIAPAILGAEEFEQQRQTLLDSVHRMSQLYDLEKSLNSTLELEEVIASIPQKAAAMVPCQAIHLWLFDGDTLRLMSSSGEDGTVEIGTMQAAGEGYVADMAEEGDPLLIDDAADERLALRNASLDDESGIAPITNVVIVPLLQDGSEIGVLEAVNRDDHPFDEDDQFFLMSMAETMSSALKNANLLHAERKLEILKSLVHVSSEITSTLRLDRLLQIIVNSPQNVLPYERSAIALDHRGQLQLKAVSGMLSLPLGDVHVDRLRELVRWLSSRDESMHLREGEGAELPVPVAHYFTETGMRALYSLPLADDQGRVGVLLYESSVVDFLDVPHTEMIKILAGQATVAIRNALLYRDVPLISLIEPLLMKKTALLSSRESRRTTFGLVAAATVLLLIACPLPMRVSGEASVAPERLVTIAAPVDGNVVQVYVHEGQRVATGEMLGAMNDWQWRSDLAAAQAKYQESLLTMQDDLAHGSAQSGADRAQVEYLRAEVARAQTRVESAQLRAPIAGIVVTANIEDEAGKHLNAGDSFAQVLDLSSAEILISVPERDAVLLHPGQTSAVKLDSYPQRTWHNTVSVVSPMAQAIDGERVFTAIVPLANASADLRAGMSGHGKVFIGWRPAGYVLLRRPALWIWETLWNWIGW